MNPYQDNYTETLNPSLKPPAGTVSRNTAGQPGFFVPDSFFSKDSWITSYLYWF
jgi:hypothetical protein